jgi:hypothetical protein
MFKIPQTASPSPQPPPPQASCSAKCPPPSKNPKSLQRLFKGSRRPLNNDDDDDVDEGGENKFPFGVPGEEEGVVGVCYATAEGEVSRDDDGRRKSMVFSERATEVVSEQVQVSKKKNKVKEGKQEIAVKGILKRTPYSG